MAIKPVLFNTEMVRAILDGRKTCTRRVIKPQPQARLCYTYAGSHNDCIGKWTYPNKGAHEFWGEKYKLPENIMDEELSKRWNPPYHTDDILYVRETWCRYGKLDYFDYVIEGIEKYYYAADGANPTPYNQFLVQRNGYDEYKDTPVWRPSIHMPKEAARIWLKVTDVRVERLQDITIEDVKNEGVTDDYKTYSQEYLEKLRSVAYPKVFAELWNSTIKKSDLDRYGWAANPWVWVIQFERCERPEEKRT